MLVIVIMAGNEFISIVSLDIFMGQYGIFVKKEGDGLEALHQREVYKLKLD